MRVLAIIFLMSVVSLPAQVVVPPDPLDALVRDSPFLPGASTARTPATGESGPLELRSIVFEQGKFFFSIYDRGSRESKWVTLGQRDLPFVARSYNQEQETLTVDYQGRTVALKLQPSHIAGQSEPGSAPPPPPLPSADEAARQRGPQPSNSVQPSPSPAPVPPPGAVKPEESQRLQEMADEIRRRRQHPVQPPKI